MAEYLSKLSVYIVVLMVLAFLFCLTALPIKLFTVNFRDLDDADKLESEVFTLAAVMCGFGNFCILGNIVFEGVSLQITGLLIAGIIAEIIAIRVQKCMIERINSEKKIGRCDFCNDLRNIEPASYLGGGDEGW